MDRAFLVLTAPLVAERLLRLSRLDGLVVAVVAVGSRELCGRGRGYPVLEEPLGEQRAALLLAVDDAVAFGSAGSGDGDSKPTSL